MKAQQQGFRNLVEDASSGKLRLPEFQRDWKWTRTKVLRLFDSIRKGYPVGGFLTLEASNTLNLSPRLFEGTETEYMPIEAYVLDGQQRITAGLALYYGLGRSHYFLDLNGVLNTATRKNLDYDNRESLKEFADDLDEEDKYIKGRARSTNPENLLLDQDLLWTPYLADDIKFSDAKERYLSRYPERVKFMERLVWPFFKIGSEPIVPVTVLDSDLPVEAITRVFETLNTSGQRLTPVEIVVAVLFARGIHLRQELVDFQELTEYYRYMESTGEIFLQVITLLDGKNPKKATLPKTITQVNYPKFKNDAIDCLERSGEFLTERFGAGLDRSSALVPYPAMLPPLGIALAEIEQQYTRPSSDKEQWQRKLERWFVGSVLEQRYTESQPTTQESDTKALLQWIREGDEFTPDWLADVRIRSLDHVSPTSAIGKLITCMISRNEPKDPLNKKLVGKTGEAIASAQFHHIFPKAFCEQHIPFWDNNTDSSNLALNVMPLTKETNRLWNKMDPLNQVADVRNQWPSELLASYEPFFINQRCLEIMEKSRKTKEDFRSFINVRGKLLQEYIAANWRFTPDAEHVEDEDEETSV